MADAKATIAARLEIGQNCQCLRGNLRHRYPESCTDNAITTFKWRYFIQHKPSLVSSTVSQQANFPLHPNRAPDKQQVYLKAYIRLVSRLPFSFLLFDDISSYRSKTIIPPSLFCFVCKKQASSGPSTPSRRLRDASCRLAPT